MAGMFALSTGGVIFFAAMANRKRAYREANWMDAQAEILEVSETGTYINNQPRLKFRLLVHSPVHGAADASELLALPPRRPPWARLLKRTLKVDGLDCPRCDAQMVLLAIITAASVIERICTHLRLPATPPTVASARSFEPAPELAFDSWDEPPEPDDPPASGRARPPP